jgi:hypothetical protein
VGAYVAMQGCLSDEVLRIPGTFQSSTSLRIVRSIRPCQATADIICLQETSEGWMAHLQKTAMPLWKVVCDTHTDIAIAYNPATVNVKCDILSIKLYNVAEHDCKRKWRTLLQAALPLLALLSLPPVCIAPHRVCIIIWPYVKSYYAVLASARSVPPCRYRALWPSDPLL